MEDCLFFVPSLVCFAHCDLPVRRIQMKDKQEESEIEEIEEKDKSEMQVKSIKSRFQ